MYVYVCVCMRMYVVPCIHRRHRLRLHRLHRMRIVWKDQDQDQRWRRPSSSRGISRQPHEPTSRVAADGNEKTNFSRLEILDPVSFEQKTRRMDGKWKGEEVGGGIIQLLPVGFGLAWSTLNNNKVTKYHTLDKYLIIIIIIRLILIIIIIIIIIIKS